jgi:hypothetical protein
MKASCTKRNRKKTYNTRDSLVVTDPTTDLAPSSASRRALLADYVDVVLLPLSLSCMDLEEQASFEISQICSY